MKKVMGGRTKKRLIKNRKVGGGDISQLLGGGLLFVFLLIGLIRSEHKTELAKNNVQLVSKVLDEFHKDPTQMNEVFMNIKYSDFSKENIELLSNAFQIEKRWVNSITAAEVKELKDLYGPAISYVEADPTKMEKIMKILEDLKLFGTMSEKNKNFALKKALMEELKTVTPEKSGGQSGPVTSRKSRKSRTSRTSGIKRGTSA